MSHSHYHIVERAKGECIEVCRGDILIGYVIFFSGGWDGWKMPQENRDMLVQVARNCPTKEEAMRQIDLAGSPLIRPSVPERFHNS